MSENTNTSTSNVIVLKNTSSNPNPMLQTTGSSGRDLYANEEIVMAVGGRGLVSTGLFIEKMSPLYELQIRSRSGLAYKEGIVVLNSPGTIDSDYKGEIKVLLVNHGTKPFVINKGDRIAQMIISNVPIVVVKYIDNNDNVIIDKNNNTKERNEGGFGSTGV